MDSRMIEQCKTHICTIKIIKTTDANDQRPRTLNYRDEQYQVLKAKADIITNCPYILFTISNTTICMKLYFPLCTASYIHKGSTTITIAAM